MTQKISTKSSGSSPAAEQIKKLLGVVHPIVAVLTLVALLGSLG